MIICDVTHSTEIAGSAVISLTDASSGEIVELRLDLSAEAFVALAESDFATLGRLSARRAPLLGRGPRGGKPRPKSPTRAPAKPAAIEPQATDPASAEVLEAATPEPAPAAPIEAVADGEVPAAPPAPDTAPAPAPRAAAPPAKTAKRNGSKPEELTLPPVPTLASVEDEEDPF